MPSIADWRLWNVHGRTPAIAHRPQSASMHQPPKRYRQPSQTSYPPLGKRLYANSVPNRFSAGNQGFCEIRCLTIVQGCRKITIWKAPESFAEMGWKRPEFLSFLVSGSKDALVSRIGGSRKCGNCGVDLEFFPSSSAIID